jgi:DNA-binding beta-propeller fold protein YncE
VVSVLSGLILSACASGPSGTRVAVPTATPDYTCSQSTPVTAPPLAATGQPTTTLALPGAPFASLTSPDGQWLFASVDATTLPPGTGANDTSALAVLRRTGPQQVQLAHLYPVPPNPFGLALSPDGHLLAVADYTGVLFFDVARAEAGNPQAELGELATTPGASTIEVLFSRDGRYVFASNEATANVSVYDLQPTGTGAPSFSDTDAVGTIAVGPYPVGMALSPDGARLYVTSELSPEGARIYGSGLHSLSGGALAVIDVARAERMPATSVVGEELTGCQPVRVALSPDGTVAWVTVRGSNTLQAFDTHRILTDPRHALLATVVVGSEPVGVLLIDGGNYALVTNSNRFAAQQTSQTVTVVNTQRALAGQPALVGNLLVGIFPRDVTLIGDTVVVDNYGSDSLSLIDAATLALSK